MNSEGIVRGTLIFGRFLDNLEIEHLKDVTRLSLTLFPAKEPKIAPHFLTALNHLLKESPIFVQPLTDESIAGYTLLKDIYGEPALILKIEEARPIRVQVRNTITYFRLALFAVGLLYALVSLLLLERAIVSPIVRLSTAVSRIGRGISPARVPVRGRDEISSLGGAINDMMDKLDESRRALTHLASFPEQNPTPVVEVDLVGNVTYMNPVAKNFLPDLEKAGIKHPYLADLEPIVKALRNQETDSFSREIAVGDSFYGQTVHYVAESERLRVYGRDITDRKQAEETLKKLYQKETELRQELEAEIRKRTDFTRALVHELKTPLTPVLASSELLIEEVKEETHLALAKNIYQGALNLNSRIDELLDLARGEIGMLTLNLKPLDLSKLLREVVDYMSPSAAKKSLSLSLETPSSPPTIEADVERLRQVLINLVSNSIKFTEEGGKITLSARKEGDRLIIEVKDTGQGISEEEQERLFSPYYRLEGDRERLSGLGLGLFLSKTLVELHGGQIWVKSKKDAGSTFAFALPLKAGSKRGDRA